jgi:hypothetical protein
VSQQTDATEIIAAINAKFSAPYAFELDAAKAQTGNHIIVFVTRRYVDGSMVGGAARIAGGRVVTRYVGRDVSDVRNMRAKTMAALEDRFLATIGPFSFEAEQESLAFDPDDGGWYVTADAWLY